MQILRSLGPCLALQVAWTALIRNLYIRLSPDCLALGATLREVLKRHGTFRRNQHGHILTIPATKGREPLTLALRLESTDYKIFCQIFRYEEYRPLVDTMQFLYPCKVEYIVDVGANIGLSTLYLRQFFSDAACVAIEPSAENTEALRLNLRLNNCEGDVKIFQNGLWVRNAFLAIRSDFRSGRESSLSVSEASAGTPEALEEVTLAEVLRQAEFPRIDILKMDIEGAERLWFESEEESSKLLEHVGALAIEIHPESIVVEQVIQRLDRLGFFTVGHGETVFAYRRAWYYQEAGTP